MNKSVQNIITILFLFLILSISLAESVPDSLSTKLTLITLVVTAFVYFLQLVSMKSQEKIAKESKDISKQSFANQENILKEQQKIASKQHDFDVFTMRLNLRNDLQSNFTDALSVTGLDVANPVNDKLVKIGRNLSDIEFAFPKTPQLTKLIKQFKKLCTEFTNLAFEKEIIIECNEKVHFTSFDWIDYKDCLRVKTNGKVQITNPDKYAALKITNKQKTIITGVMFKYLNVGETKSEIEDAIQIKFNLRMSKASETLKEICNILDKDIILHP